MAEPDTAVIQLKPFEESQCPTASPATCTITIKGYYRHSSILPAPKPTTGTTPAHFCALLLCVMTFSLSIHHLAAVPSSPTVHHCPCYTIWRRCTYPSLFHSPSTPLFSYLEIICSVTPPSCLSVRRCLIFNVMMMQALQQNGLLGSFHSYFWFLLQTCMKKKKQADFTGCSKDMIWSWCINFCRKKVGKRKQRKKKSIHSIMVMKNQYCMETKCC